MDDSGNLQKAILALKVARMYAVADLRQRFCFANRQRSRSLPTITVKTAAISDARSGNKAIERKSTDVLATVALCTLMVLLLLVPMFVPSRFWAMSDFHRPCSVLSQAAISRVLGQPMHLMPINGSVCRYVARDSGSLALFVISKKHHVIPPEWNPKYTRFLAPAGRTTIMAQNGSAVYIANAQHALLLILRSSEMKASEHHGGTILHLARLAAGQLQ